MNIESKARAGFSSIMLRGGRMTKWKGQVASYAPQVGHLQNVSVAAMAAALAFGGAVAIPSDALAQNVTVVVDTLPPPPAVGAPPVNETNNGTGSLDIVATVPIAGGPAQAGIRAINGASAQNIDIDAVDVSGTSGIIVDNQGSGTTSITAGRVAGFPDDGINVATSGGDVTINATSVSAYDNGILISNQGSGNIDITVSGSVTGNDANGISITAGDNAGAVNLHVGSVGSETQGIFIGSASGNGAVDILVDQSVLVKDGESYAGTAVAVDVTSTSARGDISVTATDLLANAGVDITNYGTGGVSVVSDGEILGADGFGINVFQGNGNAIGGITIDVNDVVATDGGIDAYMVGGAGDISITAGSITVADNAAELHQYGDTELPTISNIAQVGISVTAESAVTGDILVNVQDVFAGTAIDVINSGEGEALVESFGQVFSAFGDGISVLQDGNGNGITINANEVKAAVDGIAATILDGGSGDLTVVAQNIVATGGNGVDVENRGNGGNTSVTVNGDIKAATYGVRAYNSAAAADLAIAAGAIEANTGMFAQNYGTGDTNITLTGALTAQAGNGIKAVNYVDSGNLTIVTDDVSAAVNGAGLGGNGILAYAYGDAADISVTANGKIDAAGTYGVLAVNGAASNDIVIATKDTVSAGLIGISATNDGTGDITITADGKVTGSDAVYGIGITARNAATAGDITINATDVSGEYGISTTNYGGSTSINASGVIEAIETGVFAYGGATSESLTVNVADVAASGGNAVVAINYGTGSTSINASGTIEGGVTGDGIYALHAGVGNDLTITATKISDIDPLTGLPIATITGGLHGIEAINDGTDSSTIITVAGKVVGLTLSGIDVTNGTTATDLNVSAVDVEGAQRAILATNNGTGNTSVTLTGNATGGVDYSAVEVVNAASAKDLTISATNAAATITGGKYGILAVNNSANGGSTSVTALGKVVGATGNGVVANNAASSANLVIDVAQVDGAVNGVVANNQGTGFTSVVARGAVTGAAGNGIDVINAASGTADPVTGNVLTVDARGDVSGAVIGIKAINNGQGNALVKAAGKVTGGTGEGIFATNNLSASNLTVEAAEVSGTAGIRATNNGDGSTKITVTGPVTGTSAEGIIAQNNATSLNLEIDARGDVTGASEGILAQNIGLGDTLVTAGGNVTGGANFDAIRLGNAASAGDLTVNATNAAATIAGGVNGIFVDNLGTGSSSSVTAAGTVIGRGINGIEVQNKAGTANLTVAANNVQGANAGILANNQGAGFTSVSASGTVTGTTGDGINVTHTGTDQDLTISATALSVNGAATVSGGVNGIVAVNNGTNAATSVTALGKTVGTTGAGISATNGAQATDLAITANEVVGGTTGVLATNNGTGNTSVTLSGNVNGGAGDGIRVLNGVNSGDVTITTADVTASDNAVIAYAYGDGATISVTTNGKIAGNYGIQAATGGALGGDITIVANDDVTGTTAAINAVSVSGDINVISRAKLESTGSSSIALGARNTGDAGDIDLNLNDVTGVRAAVAVFNYGGSVVLKSNGKLSGLGTGFGEGAGIGVLNAVGTESVTLDVKDVEATLSDAILVDNKGTGFTSASASGTVTGGRDGDGINVTHTGTDQNLTISATALSVNGAATVSGGVNGIVAVNNGTNAATTVTALGKTVGTTGAGISATNGAQATDLTITANEVVGGTTGVLATNNGTGNTSVTLSGNVTGGAGFNAVDVSNAASAKDLTVNATNAAATITGGVNGIFASNKGAGSTSITAAGKVVGTTGDGIIATNDIGAANLVIDVAQVDGAVNGVVANNQGSGFTSVVARGAVTGAAGNGIDVINAASGTADPVTGNVLTVDARGDVSGAVIGIKAINNGQGNALVKAAGKVTGGTGEGIFATNNLSASNLTVEAAEVSGTAGIRATNNGDGSTKITVTGPVTGTSAEGIIAQNNATSLNLEIDARGDVTGASEGILAQNIGLGDTLVTAGGNVTGGANFDAIRLGNAASAGDLTVNATNAAATIAGGVNGIFVDNLGTGSSSSVTAAGTVIGRGINGIEVQNKAGTANLTVAANNVQGANTGILANNQGAGFTSVTASGTVTGATGDGINATHTGTDQNLTISATALSVNGAATVSGGVNGIVAVNNGTNAATSVTALGKTVGTTGAGISATNGAQATDLAITANEVVGGTTGVLATNNGTGNTSVTLTGNVTGGAGFNAVDVSNAASAKGLTVNATNAAATITGDVSGILAVNNSANGGSTSITASGKVVGTTGNAIDVANGAGSANLTINAAAVEGGLGGVKAINNGIGFIKIAATGAVIGLADDGIKVDNGSDATDVTVNAGDVTGGKNGVFTENRGKGSTSIAVTGSVTGKANAGIAAYNVDTTTTNLSLTSGNVSGATQGIRVGNNGTGDTTVIVNGSVTGLADEAILAENGARAANLSVTANGNVKGGTFGIFADNKGVGATTISALGDVTGSLENGIEAINSVTATNLTITAKNVTGGKNGIAANNFGSGFTRITATGDVKGGETGILATNEAGATDLTLSANNVQATKSGILINNKGKGQTSVTLSGNITGGTDFDAVNVTNAASAKDLTINAANASAKIEGGLNGIRAVNNGKDGSTSVTVAGSVAGVVDDGVFVEGGVDTLNMSVTVKDAAGGDEAVEVRNNGKGSTTIVASGALVGADDGLVAINTATATSLSVTAKDVTGRNSAISLNNLGTGSTTLSVSGKVSGGTGVGLSALNTAGTLATVNLAATADVGATSGNAILNNAGNSVLNVANGAVVRGTVRLGDGSDTANFALASTAAFAGITALDGGDNLSGADGFTDTLNLNGVGTYDLAGSRITNWETFNINAGTVGFSDAVVTAGALNVNAGGALNGANSLAVTANVAVAANGALLAGNAAGNSRTRIIGNLASAGLVNLSGPAGSAKAGDTLSVSGNFTGNGGQVRLDTVLAGDNSPTDLVSITGNAAGGSLLAINNTGGLGGLTTGDGIRIVQVGGTSDRDAFALLGDDVQAGGFRYDLFLGGIADPNDQDWYLRTVGASDIAATTLSFARLSDDIAMTFLGTLHERVGEQEHLAKRGYPSSGFGGLWGRFVGKGFRERLSSATLGEIKSTGSITGLQMGLDFGRSIKSDGSATFTGAYAGYADGNSNDQNIFRNVARRSGTSGSKGWLTGLYATHYGSTGWYANAVVQASWVDASASARNGVTLESDGRTYLGSVELGKSLKLGNRLAFETQAQLIYGETRFDDARDSAGIANKIRVEDSLTGRVGFRLKTTKDEKYNTAGGLFSGYLKANLWHNLLGSDVRLNTAGVDLGKFEPKKTWVDAGLGTTLTVAKNTELFFDADVEIGLDRKTAAGTGKAGLRINW